MAARDGAGVAAGALCAGGAWVAGEAGTTRVRPEPRAVPRVRRRAPIAALAPDADGAVHLANGDMVEETAELVNPEPRAMVALVLPIASGLEPLNPTLATATAEATPSAGPTLTPSYPRSGMIRSCMSMRRCPPGRTVPLPRRAGTIGASPNRRVRRKDVRQGDNRGERRNAAGHRSMIGTLASHASGRVGWRSGLAWQARTEKSPRPSREGVRRGVEPTVIGAHTPPPAPSARGRRIVLVLLWSATCFPMWVPSCRAPISYRRRRPRSSRTVMALPGAVRRHRYPPAGRPATEYGYWPVDPRRTRRRATLALEDRNFWFHPGVDPGAVRARCGRTYRTGGVRGPPRRDAGGADAASGGPHPVGESGGGGHGGGAHRTLRARGGPGAIFAAGALRQRQPRHQPRRPLVLR